MKIGRRGSELAKKSAVYGFLTLLAIYTGLPFIWMVVTSVKPELEIFRSPPTLLPSRISTQHYEYVTSELGFSVVNFFINTTMVSMGTIACVLPLSIFAGYGFTRFKFKLNSWLFLFILFLNCVPHTVYLVPIYQFIRSIELLNNLISLVIVYTAFQLPFSTWIVKGFFDSLPIELEESAMIDGCSRLTALFRILLPLSWPIVVTTSIFSLLGVWNEFIFATVLITSMKKFTLSPGLLTFFGFTQIHYGPIMASSTLATIPVIIIFMLVQRLYVKGITAGALKG